MKKVFVFFVMLLIARSSVSAAVVENGYYKLKNVSSSQYLGENYATSGLKMYGSASNTSYEAIWKITNNSNGTVLITNVYTQKWIRGVMTVAQTLSTSNSQYGEYPYTAEKIGDNIRFVFYRWDSSCALYLNQGCHSYNSGTDSQWKLEKVTISDPNGAAGAKKVEDMNKAYASWNTKLQKYFKDLSCSELKDEYQSMSDEELLAATTDLTSDLQNVALKVKNQWGDDGVSGRTKQFRVQNYKVYSDAYSWASKLGAWGMGDMNNPTGIYANQKEILYVFVGGDIPTGTQLRLASNYGNGYISRDNGPVLHKGMNTLMISGDNYMQWVMYTAIGSTTTPLSNYPDLKIHIEGGHVLGYMDCESQNGYSTIRKENEADINARYKQVLADANTLATADGKKNVLWFTAKGNYGVFLFPLYTYNNIWGDGKIYKSMLWYDNVLMWIWDLMGINKRTADGEADPANGSIECVTGGEAFYPTYCNNKSLTILDTNDKNPNGGSWHTDYPSESAVKGSYDYDHNAGMDNWCTAHESGHQNQSRINMASGTEVSNNLFSNVVVYNHGYRLSRGETLTTNLNYYLAGTQYAYRGGGMTHRMYYQLYLYYHLARHRMDFYPRLFQLLRNSQMNLNSGKDSFLKFYKFACEAAQEDLTEFFRVWGFFVPFNNAYFGDYTSRYLTLTQDEIDAAIAEVKAKAKNNNWRRNDEIILIEDRIQNSKRTDIYSTGSEWKVAMDRAAGSGVGDLGHYTDFMEGKYSKGSYSTYKRSGNTITVSGTDGVGFLVYNGDGEVIGFSNKKTFTLNEGAFSHTGITYKSIDGDGTLTELTRDPGNDATLLAELNTAIEDVTQLLYQKDNGENKVGFYYPSALTTLETLLAEAKKVRDNKNTVQYDIARSKLSDEYAKVKNSEYSRIWFVPGNSYYLKNTGYNYSPYLTCDENGKMYISNTMQKWLFESAGANQYYIKNLAINKYFSDMNRTNATATATAKSGAYGVTMKEYSKDGKFNINPNDKKNNLGNYYLLGYEYKTSDRTWHICGTALDEYYTQWQFVLADESSASKAISALVNQVAAAEAALNKVGYGYKDVTYTTTPKAMRTCKGPFSLTSNAEQDDGMLEMLYDGDNSKGFHSSWDKGSVDGGNHYIQIDCGYSDKMDLFKFAFYNRPGDSSSSGRDSPTGIIIKGSNDGINFTDIRTMTTADGLPTATGKQSQFVSDVIGVPGIKYRYLRFVVTNTNTAKAEYVNTYGHPYFYLAEFAITKVKADMTYSKMDGYSNVSKSAIIAVKQEIEIAKSLLDTGTEAQKNAETPILKAAVERLQTATSQKIPDDEVAELTEDEMYKYQDALDSIIGDAERAKTAMGTGVLDSQIAAAVRVRQDSISTYLNLQEEKDVLTEVTKSELRSAINGRLAECKTMLDNVLESYSFVELTDTTYTISYERKEAYHELDGLAIERLLTARHEAEVAVAEPVFSESAIQTITTAYSNLVSAFDGLNQSKANIDRVKALAEEKLFKYYSEGNEEKPGYPTYEAYLEMKKVYDADRSADDILEAWNEYLASPRSLPKAGRFYKFKCVNNNWYLYSSLSAVSGKTNRLAMGTTATTNESTFLWTGNNLCGYANNTTVTMNTSNMLSNNTVSGTQPTQIIFESDPGTEKIIVKFNGGNRVAYGGLPNIQKENVTDAGSFAADDGYKWIVEPVDSFGDIRDYAITVIDNSEKVGWPSYRSRSDANTLRQAVEDAQEGNPDKILIAFDRMNKFKNSVQSPEDGMALRLRSARTDKYVKSGTTNGTYSMGADMTESIFYYLNGYLLCYSNGIFMACTNASWNWANAGATSGGIMSFISAKTNHAFHIKIPSSRADLPSCALYARSDLERCDRGGFASDDAVKNQTDLGYTWYLDLVDSLPVTIGSAGYATFSAPVPLQIPKGLMAYYAENFDPTTAQLSMKRIDGIIPANTGVVLKGKGTFNLPIAYDDKTETISGNKLFPVVPSTNVVANEGYTAFILGKKNDVLSFYPLSTTSNTVGGHKAYLELSTADVKAASEVKSSISINWDDEATSIVEIMLDSRNAASEDLFNLSGQKVGRDYKGIIIRNGRKFLNN